MVITIEPGIYIPEENLGGAHRGRRAHYADRLQIAHRRLPRSPTRSKKIMADGTAEAKTAP